MPAKQEDFSVATRSNDTAGSAEWKILVLDARAYVHQATGMLLEQISFAGKTCKMLNAYTLEDAKKILLTIPDVAVVLMDIEIDGQRIGLDLIHFIRRELQNEKMRIVLRTGYSDFVSEQELIKTYEVDGCLSDEEFSKSSFELVVLAAIQTYNQIVTVTGYLQGLAGSIAHEMRNPLNYLNTSFYTIKSKLTQNIGKLPKEDVTIINELLDVGQHVCKHANLIINMTLQCIKDQQIDTQSFRTLSAAEVVRTAMLEFAFQDSTSKEKVALNLEQDFELWGDESLFIYVLFNLLKNSLFFLSSKRDLQIDIRLEKGVQANTLYFRDNGPGIPESVISRIFDNFMTSGKKEGTGLGLAFCKRVMKAFGGDVTCRSEPGCWTEFSLTFPKQPT